MSTMAVKAGYVVIVDRSNDFVPFLGVLVYLIARGGGMTKRATEQQQEMQRQQGEYVRSVVATSGGGSNADQIASAKQSSTRERSPRPSSTR